MSQTNEVAPKLRFSGFEKNWDRKPLKKLTSYVDYRGRGPTKSDSGIFLVTAKNIRKGYIDYSSKEYVPEDKYDSIMSKGLPEIGDVLFTTEAPLGMVAQVEDSNIALAQRVIKFRGKENLTNSYLLYYMLSSVFQRKILRRAIGSTVLGISNKELSKISVKYPEITEQQKIADFLSSVDRKIQQMRRKKEMLEEYKKGVMQKLFSQEIRFRDENGEAFPDWEYKELGEISDRVTDKNENEEYEFVLTNSATEGVVSQTEYFDKSIANKSNLGGYYIVQKDDFVYNPRISKDAPVGPIKRNKLKTGVMSPLYSVFRIKECNLDFFEYFFETTYWHRYMHSVANFGARHDRMNITVGDFKKLPVPIPCIAERNKITDYLNQLTQKCNKVAEKLELAEIFKKGLLQQMFV